MSVALSGNAPATFEIKSANLPLVALLLKSADLTLFRQELQQRYGDMPAFFDNDPLLIDLSLLPDSVATVDFAALVNALRPHSLLPIAVRGGRAELIGQAQAAGLVLATDAIIQRTAAAATPSPASTAAAPAAKAAAPVAPTSAMVIDKPLRSGQQVYARGRDLIVMAMVNPGAEVIADGHIHVYAPLRGKAMAGARGNVEARIMALSMEAQLLSIAGVYRTSENALPPSVYGKAAQVRLESHTDGQDKLIIEPLKN
ncbi:MAG: septum site-determining protein MinC [Pseudomonadota bacterium]|jgi:septum site-determining protein MinC